MLGASSTTWSRFRRAALTTRRNFAVACNKCNVRKSAAEKARYLKDNPPRRVKGQHGTDDDRRVAPRAAAAVLSLVAQRLDLLGRVIGKEVNAKLLLAHHNIVRTQSGDEDGPDIFLEVDGASERRSWGA
jgi:hypothetical protein